MDLSKLKPKTKKRKVKRLGRGVGSTLGKTSGRGHKGAGQRKGKKTPYAGFEGGNIPYFRKIPKRGFNLPRRTVFQIVNLTAIEKVLADVKDINKEVLKNKGLIRSVRKPVKILAYCKQEFKLKINFTVDAYSAKAKEIIEAAGGTIQIAQNGAEENNTAVN
ncbi:MAG: 50S ribosomal protein L15 [Candidatus Omnitrophica bacterium]|nr:50S ribosomal protein L15 [Candidatus Omnitrophota bacterium]MDD5080753.1 50S ribosomal protein L15 [Candidatus Omnitrophota bacterium]MDD5441265.1 50S ribosomal protein L15 [Candidatus Omnitrophota bacterium]